MSRDHYKGVPKRRTVVVKKDGNLDVEGKQHPAFDDPTQIDGLVHASRLEHQTVVDAATAEFGEFGGVTSPTLKESGPLLSLSFTASTDAAFRVFKIRYDYLSDPSFHLHWTKPDDVDRSGTFAKWCVEYSVFNGSSEDAALTTTIVDSGDVEYLDSGTTTRVIYRTSNIPLTGFAPGKYVAIKVQSLSPTGSALPGPCLVSMDLIYRANINLGN
jgi:hypothetical protein